MQFFNRPSLFWAFILISSLGYFSNGCGVKAPPVARDSLYPQEEEDLNGELSKSEEEENKKKAQLNNP